MRCRDAARLCLVVRRRDRFSLHIELFYDLGMSFLRLATDMSFAAAIPNNTTDVGSGMIVTRIIVDVAVQKCSAGSAAGDDSVGWQGG
jgi:hypothetical protein